MTKMPKFWPTEIRQECVNLSIEPTTLPNPSNPRVSQRLGFVWTSGSSAPCLSGQFDCSTVSFRALFTQSIVDCIGIVVHRYLPRWVEMKVRGEIRDLSYRVNIKFIGKNLSLVVFGYRMYDSKLCIISMLQDTCRAKIVVKPEHVVLPIEVGAGGSVRARKRRKLRNIQYVKQYCELCSISNEVNSNTNSQETAEASNFQVFSPSLV